jgi:hypothetical protein
MELVQAPTTLQTKRKRASSTATPRKSVYEPNFGLLASNQGCRFGTASGRFGAIVALVAELIA